MPKDGYLTEKSKIMGGILKNAWRERDSLDDVLYHLR